MWWWCRTLTDATGRRSANSTDRVGRRALRAMRPGEAGGIGQQRCEPLHPPVDRDVVDLDTALGQQLLHIAVKQAVAQVPADRHCDHLGWEPEPGERRPGW